MLYTIAFVLVILWLLGLVTGTTNSHFIPPVAGALMLVGGIVLLVVKPKSV